MKVLGRKIMSEDMQNELRNLKFAYNEDRATKSLDESLDEYEEQLIREALDKHNWNQSRAARALKIPVQTIRYKMNKLGIEKADRSE